MLGAFLGQEALAQQGGVYALHQVVHHVVFVDLVVDIGIETLGDVKIRLEGSRRQQVGLAPTAQGLHLEALDRDFLLHGVQVEDLEQPLL